MVNFVKILDNRVAPLIFLALRQIAWFFSLPSALAEGVYKVQGL
jgi:hypothetical protein